MLIWFLCLGTSLGWRRYSSAYICSVSTSTSNLRECPTFPRQHHKATRPPLSSKKHPDIRSCSSTHKTPPWRTPSPKHSPTCFPSGASSASPSSATCSTSDLSGMPSSSSPSWVRYSGRCEMASAASAQIVSIAMLTILRPLMLLRQCRISSAK